MNCYHCNAEIPPQNLDQSRQLIHCSDCQAVISLTGDEHTSYSAGLSQTLAPAPDGLQIIRRKDKLQITRRWAQKGAALTMLTVGLVWNGITVILLVGNQSLLLLGLLFLALGLLVLYFALVALVNQLIITASPQWLTIENRPLPAWGNKQIQASRISQLYVQQIKHKSKNSVSFSYALNAVTTDGDHQPLAFGLEKAPHAFELEREIEQFLSIKDKPVAEEMGWSGVRNREKLFEAWQTLALNNRLQFKPGKILDDLELSGNYHGSSVRLTAQHPNEDYSQLPQTCLLLTAGPHPTDETGSLSPTSETVYNLLTPTYQKRQLSGRFQGSASGKRLTYKQNGAIDDLALLQHLLDGSHRLLQAVPQILALGATAIPLLEPVAKDTNHPACAVAQQLIEEIAQGTNHLRDRLSTMWCKDCLTHPTRYQLKYAWFRRVDYYACRICGQSNQFYHARQLVAMLDSTKPPQQQGQTLRFNWLVRRELFDFDAVEIGQASAEDVERFAVQVGNDTAPLRQPRYKQMLCTVTAGNHLSPDSIRILQRTFGQVDIR